MNKTPAFDYYTAPSDVIFHDIKQAAIRLWNRYDNTYGYVTEKVNRIKDLDNIRDNSAYIVAMFDHHNQMKLFDLVADTSTVVWLEKLINYSKGY